MREPEFNVFTLQSATAWATGRSTCLVFRDSGGVQLSSDGLFEFAEGVSAAAVGFDANGELWFVHGGTGDLCRIRDQRERDAQAAQASPGRGCDAKESLYCRISPFSVDTDQESVARPANIVVAATKIWLADSSGGRVWGLLRPTLQVGTMIDLGSPIASLQVDRCGDLYVLTISHSIHRYDRDGHSETVLEPPPIEGAELPWRPTAIATDREGNLFVVDQNNHVVLRRHGRGDWAVAFSLPAPLRTDQPLLLTVDRLGIVYVGDPRQKTVSGEPRWFVTMFGLGGDVIGTLHSILGPFRYLLTDHQGGVYGFNTAGQLVVLSGSSASYATEGSFTSPVFDSRDTETSWHRVALDAEQNERTRLEVEAFITNTEPDDIASIPEEDWKLILHSPFEGRPAADGLFDDMVGQFCVLRLRLQGDGGSTPVVSRLRVFFPEQSYLRYLPAIYGEDPIGSRNMRRFLSLFESVNWEFDQEILNLARRFDLQVGSGEFIDWMATWLALAGDANWPLDVRRRVLSGSYALFEKRGTLDGLRDLVRLYTGSPPSIIEHFRLRRPIVLGDRIAVGINSNVGRPFPKQLILEESSRVGEFVLLDQPSPPEWVFEQDAFNFSVFVRGGDLDSSQRASLQRLLQLEKPAHTWCIVRFGATRESGFQLGAQAILGIDTRLGSGHPTLSVGERSTVGKNTIVGTAYFFRGTVGARARLGTQTLLH